MPAPIVIITPLAIEHAAAVRAMSSHPANRLARFITCGPGPANARRAVERSVAGGSHACILFGVAGGLSPSDVAPRISRVIDSQGNSWTPSVTHRDRGSETPGTTVLGIDAPVCTPDAKRRLAASTGASVVDCESHAFAAAAAASGTWWRVVRGISDPSNEALPANAARWIDDRGRTRVMAAVLDLIFHPSLWRTTIRLSRRTSTALHTAGTLLRTVVDEAAEYLGSGDPT